MDITSIPSSGTNTAGHGKASRTKKRKTLFLQNRANTQPIIIKAKAPTKNILPIGWLNTGTIHAGLMI